MNKRIFAVLLTVLFLASLASAQTLVEAAKKEKERRDAIKNKTSVPVTNADLTQVKKKPAVDSPKTEPPKEGAPPREAPPPVSPEVKVLDPGVESQREYDAKKNDLQTKHASAKERLDLLNLKLQSLWQRYYTFNNMQSKEQLQREIAETNLKLKEAAAEEAKIRDDLSKLAAQAPPTVIK